jgi:hypothetical protein
VISIPRGFALSKFPRLGGKQLYAWDPTLTFYQSGRPWQTSQNGQIREEGPGFPGARVTEAVDIGIATNHGLHGLNGCEDGD